MSELWAQGMFLFSSHMKIVAFVSTLEDWSGCISPLPYLMYSFNALIAAQSPRNTTVKCSSTFVIPRISSYLPPLRRTPV